MDDVEAAVVDRYMAGWRPSQTVASMWEKFVDDPDAEAMTPAEAEFLVQHNATFLVD